jgi:hypothetical protein
MLQHVQQGRTAPPPFCLFARLSRVARRVVTATTVLQSLTTENPIAVQLGEGHFSFIQTLQINGVHDAQHACEWSALVKNKLITHACQWSA